MDFVSYISFRRKNSLFIFSIIVYILFCNHVAAVDSQDTTEIFYDCEKYCHMDCVNIPESDPFHKEQCKAVHSHHSDCSCHFGGVAMGVFLTLGIFTIIILMACSLRHCRGRRRVTNTRIVVVTQPVSAEDLQNNNYQYQTSQQNVYSIPMETKRTNYYPKLCNDHEEESTITVITSRSGDPIADSQPTSPNAPSRRIYFENSTSTVRHGSEDIFAPPTF